MTFTAAARRCALLAAGLALGGLLLGRADVAALAAPFVVGLAWGLLRRRMAAPSVSVSVDPPTVHEGETVEVRVHVDAGDELDVAVIRVAGAGFAVTNGRFCAATSVGALSGAVLSMELVAQAWGRRRVGPVTCTATGALGMVRQIAPVQTRPLPVAVLPAVPPFRAADPVPRAVVFAGTHRSRAVGPGAEFAGIRPFTPGDPPRRINWPASTRAGELLTNAAVTDRAARVWVLLDSQYGAGAAGRVLLDVAVRAAAGIADHYLTVGDSVGLAEYGGRSRVLPPAGGSRQRALVNDWLLDAGPVSAARPPAWALLGALRTAGALVTVLTPFLDAEAAAHLVQLRRAGAAVLAVDTLVDGAIPPACDRRALLARRIWLLERRAFMAPLADLGIPVVRWAGSGTLDVALADLARMAGAARVVVR